MSVHPPEPMNRTHGEFNFQWALLRAAEVATAGAGVAHQCCLVSTVRLVQTLSLGCQTSVSTLEMSSRA